MDGTLSPNIGMVNQALLSEGTEAGVEKIKKFVLETFDTDITSADVRATLRSLGIHRGPNAANADATPSNQPAAMPNTQDEPASADAAATGERNTEPQDSTPQADDATPSNQPVAMPNTQDEPAPADAAATGERNTEPQDSTPQADDQENPQQLPPLAVPTDDLPNLN
ncbi:hypothetical protein DL768_008588 [Monosporascus sp. mg162]|nr:hypothetical protein DL768_008588 [Monosporascus sp. mg162]